ncbi:MULTISPECIES: hypothetical protein [unclassified Bradyrhizobium]|nr:MULTISPECIES: hypothetical protein [unclassified Bradyrhizobium]
MNIAVDFQEPRSHHFAVRHGRVTDASRQNACTGKAIDTRPRMMV